MTDLDTRVRRALCRHPMSNITLRPQIAVQCALCGESWRVVERRRRPQLVEREMSKIAVRALRAGMSIWAYAIHTRSTSDAYLAEWHLLTTNRRRQFAALATAAVARSRAFVVVG